MKRIPTVETLPKWDPAPKGVDENAVMAALGRGKRVHVVEQKKEPKRRMPFDDVSNRGKKEAEEKVKEDVPVALDESLVQAALSVSLMSIPEPSVADAFDAASQPPLSARWELPSRIDGKEDAVDRTLPPGVVELDAPDQDPMLTSEYAMEIYDNLRDVEHRFAPDPAYLSAHPELSSKDRGVLVDWMADLCIEYKLVSETLYLSVNYMDRFLSHIAPVQRTKLQLVGMVGVFLASKYEEIYPCTLEELRFISDNAFTADQILRYETAALKALDFELSAPTPKMFLRRAVRAAQCDRRTSLLANYLCELSLLDYDMIPFAASTVAASSVALALHTMGRPAWTPSLRYYTRLDEAEIVGCVRALYQQHLAAASSSLVVIRDKYSHANFLHVGKIACAKSLPPFARKDKEM